MREATQVQNSDNYCVRPTLVTFEVSRGLDVPVAVCANNLEFGKGGATQFFITAEERNVHLRIANPGMLIDSGGQCFFNLDGP